MSDARSGADVPTLLVPRSLRGSGSSTADWETAAAAGPFRLADDSDRARERTEVRVSWDDAALHVRFVCEDDDIWGRYRGRDEPLWEEEAVEIFLSPGGDPPRVYFELEFNPFGAVFDAIVRNPTSTRREMRVDAEWDCAGLVHAARVLAPERRWTVEASIPWRGLGVEPPVPALWRANFFRIERPRRGTPEFSAWSPPRTDPPDFHKPERFGRLLLEGAERE